MYLQIFETVALYEPRPRYTGFHEIPCADVSVVLNLVDMLMKIIRDFQLFKKNVLNVGFCNRKPSVMHQRTRNSGQLPAAFSNKTATTNL